MVISDNHKKMWELFDKVRFSKSLEECRKVIEEEMGPIVEEEKDLKYYVDAAEKICEIVEHIEGEKNPEKGNEKPEISVDFKQVMAAVSKPTNKYDVVAFPDRMHKGKKDDKVRTPLINKFIREVTGLLNGYDENKPLFLAEKDGSYFVSTSRSKLNKSFIPAKFTSNGKRASDKFVPGLDIEASKITKINDPKFLLNKLLKIESKSKPVNKKASFEEVMKGLA